MGSQETFKIFCGNLSPVTNGSDLRSLFSKHGSVIEADVIIGKNFGFVHMSSETEGTNALYKLQGYVLNGEKMNVQRAINSKRASAAGNLITLKRNIVGQGVSNLDDFESYYEIHENFNIYNQDLNFLKHSSPSQSPVNYNIPINPNLSDNSSGRPSPLLLSSASSTSYTPEHVLQQSKSLESKTNQLENLLIDQDNSFCGICNEEFNDQIHLPKILSCKHTFCLDCLTSLAKLFEIKCPLGCPYITILHESGVTGLTTNQTKIIKQEEVGSVMSSLQNDQNSHSFSFIEQEVCCMCLCTPPGKLCSVQKHQIMKESEAASILKSQLRILLEFSVTTLRNVMAMQATLKERMQYTLHSLNKFSEELRLKIEGEELEQNIQQSLLVDLHEMNDTLTTVTNINDLLHKFSKVSTSSQDIASKFRHCYAKDTVNSALESVLLELKEPLPDSCLNLLGFNRKEGFSLASSLKENADKGNFANVLLIYLLSDLLFTRYRPANINTQMGFAPYSHSFGGTSPVKSSAAPSIQEDHDQDLPEESLVTSPTHDDLFDINTMLETTKAIESHSLSNGGASSSFAEGDMSPPPVASSALSLGLSNFSLTGEAEGGTTPPFEGSDPHAGGDSAPRPFSYLDALKKPAKHSSTEGQAKPLARLVPSPLKPSAKFPHCWMVLSVNGVNAGRIIFQLRPDKAPNMCDNFVGLCTGRSGYGYKGTHFFKSGDGFLVGGDVENDDGTGGYSVYDKQKFEADLCPLKDDVGMVRFKGIGTSDKGRGMVGSQFMIWYTEREFKKFSFSLVFGKVVDGLDIVQEAANHNLHKVAIKVEECGAI